MSVSESAAGIAVRRTVTVEVPVERAFEVFTAGFDRWWPRTHHIGAVDMAEAVLEPEVGGRWYERAVDGSECEWGRVLAWEPPAHVAVSWCIDGNFRAEPDPEKCSRVDVTFHAETPERTRVELVHSGIERHGESAEALSTGVGNDEGGWLGILVQFRTTVEAR
jgi:uncharacterized protein YndB with AHSA1/START domain